MGSRRGQSAADTLAALSAVLLVALALAAWRFEELLPWVHQMSIELQTTPIFDQIVELVQG